MTDDPIRWGILGAGRVAEGFATGLAAAPSAQLVAVASRTPANAAAFAARHGVARLHETYEALAGDPQVDVVYVATPNDRHAADAVMCIEAGKAVLCEKPFTVDGESAARVAAAARAAGTFCMEGMWMRFIPTVRRAFQLVDEGAIGEVRAVHADFSHPVQITPTSRLFDPRQGGGALLDLGVYTLSLAQMLLGEPETVQAHLAVGSTGVDEHASVVLGYRSGAIATLTSSLRALGPNRALIVGGEGRIVLAGPICSPTRLVIERVADANEERVAPSGLMRLVTSNRTLEHAARAAKHGVDRALRRGVRSERFRFRANGYEYEAIEVMDCLRRGGLESAVMPLDDSIATLRIIDAIRRDHGLG